MFKKVLVTGADGFIGSHVVETLVRRHQDVKAFVCYNSFDSWGWLDHAPADLRKSFEVVAGDVRDPHCVREAMRGCDAVMHLAALIAIPYSYRAPQSYVDVNINGTLNVVQAAHELGVAKVMHTSTSEVYGTAQSVPISESHPLVGQSPYAASKIGADQVALSYFYSFQTPVAVVRPFNTYGPRQSTRAVIPTIISQIASGCRQIQLGSLTPTRDFNFVEDTVNGMIAVLHSVRSIGQVFNLGSGYEISVGNLVQLIAQVMDAKVEILSREERVRPENSEVQRLVADASRARTLLGWKPKFAGLEGLQEGLRQTAAWFTNPNNLAFYHVGQYTI